MRSFVKSPIAVVLFLLLVAALVLTMGDPLPNMGGGGFIRAGERSAGPQDATRYLDLTLKRLQAERNETLSRKEASERGYTRQIIDDMIQRTTTLAYTDKIGVSASPREVARQMGKMFPDGLGGVNQGQYGEYLRQINMQPKAFTKELRDEVTYEYLQRALMAGLAPPDLMSNPVVTFIGEKRMVAMARFTANSLPKIADPDEPALRAFYTERGAMFAQPERRRISALVYSAADYVDKADIKDSEIKSEYDRRIKDFSAPETRTLAQFTSSDRKAIQAVIDLAKQGKTLEAAVAATPGVTLAAVTVKAADITNADYSKAAFSWPLNETVGPIDNEGSFLGFQVKAIIPGAAQTFERVREQVRADMAQREAKRLYDSSAEQVNDLVAGGATLEDVAKEVGAPILSFEPADARGVRKDGGGAPVALLAKYPDQAALLFQQQAGTLGDVVEGDGERAVFRVDEIVKAYTPPFEEVREQLKPLYTAVKELEAASKIAADVVTVIKGGKAFDDAAKQAKLGVIRPPQPLRRSQEQGPIDPAVVQAAFNLKEGETAVATGQSGEPWVIQVLKIEQINPQEEPQLTQQVKNSVGQSLANDIMVAFARDVRTAVKPKINEKAIKSYIDSFTSATE